MTRSGRLRLDTTGPMTALLLASILAGCEAQPSPKPPADPASVAPSAVAIPTATASPPVAASASASAAPTPVDPSPTGEAAQRAARELLVERHYTSRGGRVFCAVEPFGSRPTKAGAFELFVWADCEEFVREGGALGTGSGSSLPCTVTLVLERGAWRATAVKQAEDGSRYDPSIRAMFSREAYERMAKQGWSRGALRERVRREAESTPF